MAHRRHRKERYVFVFNPDSDIHVAEAFSRKRFRCVAAVFSIEEMPADDWDDGLSQGYEDRMQGVVNVHCTRTD